MKEVMKKFFVTTLMLVCVLFQAKSHPMNICINKHNNIINAVGNAMRNIAIYDDDNKELFGTIEHGVKSLDIDEIYHIKNQLMSNTNSMKKRTKEKILSLTEATCEYKTGLLKHGCCIAGESDDKLHGLYINFYIKRLSK